MMATLCHRSWEPPDSGFSFGRRCDQLLAMRNPHHPELAPHKPVHAVGITLSVF